MDQEEEPILVPEKETPSAQSPHRTGRLLNGISADIIPTNYDLKFIILNDHANIFTCDETIDITVCAEAISTVVLNGCGLNIKRLLYKGKGKECDTSWRAPDCQYSDDGQILEIHFTEPLKRGGGSISITFEGAIKDDMTGFYRFKAQRDPSCDTSKLQWNFATQLEPGFARKVFFCWDEPESTAVFRISLVIPKNWTGLSNMPVLNNVVDTDDDSLAVISFDQTPAMPAHLLALAFGSLFDFVEGNSSDKGIICRVYTPTEKQKLGTFALSWAIESVSYFTDYFCAQCPIPKLDIVSVAELASGSTENWGLITLKEDYVLIDAVRSTFFAKQWCSLVLSHEICQQWFGNAVTFGIPDLWLKESMATFLEYSCVDSINSKADVWLHFAVNMCANALSMDSMEGGRPISVQNGGSGSSTMTHCDSMVNFDTLSHLKGACLLRMLNSFIPAPLFRNGICSFLKSSSYKTNTATDFWTALEEAGFTNAQEIARHWTSQTGFPLIKIAEWKQLKDARVLVLTQEKFCANPRFNENKRELKSFQWFIPLEFVSVKEPKKVVASILMKSSILEVAVPTVTKGDWVKIRSIGFFRVHYPPSMMRDLLMAVKSKQMQPLDRIGLLDDLFHLCKCGEVTTIEVLQALKVYSGETNYYVWQTISAVLKSLHTLFEFTSFNEKFEGFAVSLLRKVYQRVRFDAAQKEAPLEEELRTTILLRMVELNDRGVIEEGMKRFRECVMSGDLSLVPTYLRPVLYSVAVAGGSKKYFKELLNMYETSTSQEDRKQIMRACAFARTEDSVNLLLDYIVNQSAGLDVISTIMYSMCSSRIGIEKVWGFFCSQVTMFKTKFRNCRTIHTLVKRMIEDFCDNKKAVEIEEFFKNNDLDFLNEVMCQGVESIRTREAWLARDGAELEEYLTRETTDVITID